VIGWFGEGIVDWIGDRVSDAGDAFSEVAAVVPFAPELGGALRDVINGPLRDFARTPYGLAVLRAMSTTIYGPMAWTIGPQVASLFFALPGLARGDDFLEAWLTEVQWRAEETAEVLAPGAAQQITPEIQSAATKLAQVLPEDLRAMALSELAARLKVDEWTAEMARSLALMLPVPRRELFDPITGARRRSVTLEREASVAERTRSSMLASWAVRQAPVDERMRSTSFAYLAGGSGGVAPSSAAVATTAPDEPAPRPRTSTAGNVALIGLIGLAGASLVWFYSGDKS
jgi:hypothetical protein